MPLSNGQPLRSDTLNQEFEAARRGTREVEARLAEAERQAEAVRLALLAREVNIPATTDDGVGGVTYFTRATHGAGTEVLGGAVVTARLQTSASITDPEPSGQGAIDLLRPGLFVARTSDSERAQMEVRMDPAYLVEYDELVLPHVAGAELSWRLYHDQGSHLYDPVLKTEVHRFTTPRRFNGRIVVDSRSRSRVDGRWVHVVAAPWLALTDWVSEGTVEGSVVVDRAGPVRLKGATAYGTEAYDLGTADDPVVLEIDGTVRNASNVHVVESGQRLTVSGVLPWDKSAAYLGVELSYVV